MTASYTKNTGYYQKRADYYNQMLETCVYEEDNIYINVYSCIVNLYNNFHQSGIKFFENQQSRPWEICLTTIRDIEGLARCWGHALETLELIERWRVLVNEENISIEETALSELLSDSLESLMTSILEIMPAYVSWVPTAQLEENQHIVDFLQKRGNTYRAMGNPKFYAYDRVVDAIAAAAIPINDANCIYVKGSGPHITEHIRDFLRTTPEEPSPSDSDTTTRRFGSGKREEEPSNTTVEPKCPLLERLTNFPGMETVSTDKCPFLNRYKECPHSRKSEHPDCSKCSFLNWYKEKCSYLQPACGQQKKSFPDIECPAVYNSTNQSLADYLWRGSIDFYRSKQMGRAWAWRRAAETVCATQDIVQKVVDNQLPYIGEKMSDVVREFYQYYDSPVDPPCKRQCV